ncbi:proteoglycan Cow [Amyelois transitella]|uniref:proteoglycan Cow n=1 Tax=Amyelois transitella TaxID=680683 RepID=UPI00299072A7|nr:proteoglycan Cow [Amyelois transitella]
MRARVWAAAAALGAVLAVAAARDQDFEFDDDADASAGAAHSRRPRRYIYDPHNSLCQSLICKKREVCLLRDAFTALCVNKKDALRRGDVIVTSTTTKSIWDEDDAPPSGAAWRGDGDDDVFYDGGARVDALDAPDVPEPESKPERCVGCPARVRARFLCGSDNRTYSSLCRLDLHNCVRRPARPVQPACRGFCPCAPRPRTRPRNNAPARARNDDYDDDWRRRKSDSGHNEVLSERSSRRRLSQGSEGCALDKMANRLLDWFSVLMEEAGATTGPEEGFPADCKPEVRWMFSHLDTDGDGLLSAANLYSLRHDDRERCLRPFLSSCGGAGGEGRAGRAGGAGVSRAAWCGCLRRAARPCIALARAHPDPHPGAYVPSCDARGFYRPRQCHAALGVCWCVDPHGAELPGSRGKGALRCAGDKAAPALSNETAEGAPADDEDAPASGDGELRF